MSLIHEALEKIDEEKKARLRRSDPGKFFRGVPVAPPVKESKTVIYAIAGILLFFFMVGGIYLGLHPQKAVPPPHPVKKTMADLPFFNAEERFLLTGITRIASDWNAIINNKLVKTGNWVDGALVQSIQRDKVILRFQDRTLVLALYADTAATHFTELEAS